MSTLVSAALTLAPVVTGWWAHTLWLSRRLDCARRDPLTGLATRAAFTAAAHRLMRQGPVAVVVVDLDGFKAINDAHGHAAGDAALVEVGRRLCALAGGGLVARLGGDEFAALVPMASPVDLPTRLRELHEALFFSLRYEGARLPVAASIGGIWSGELPAPVLSLALRRADEAMYAAKRTRGGWLTAAGAEPTHASVNGRRAGRAGAPYLPDGGERR